MAKPDVRTEELGVGDDVVILASDGLWDVLSNKDACELVKDIQARPAAVLACAWRAPKARKQPGICIQACDLAQVCSMAANPGSSQHSAWA